MNLLINLNESINLNKLKGVSYDKVKEAFMANYLASLLFLKIQDLQGLKLINDASHANLKKFSSTMSDLNFWGKALFFSDDKEVKNRMLSGHAAVLADQAGRVSYPRLHKIMNIPSTSPEKIDWQDTIAAVMLLRYRFKIDSSYLDRISHTLYKWESVGVSAKQKAINDSYMFLLQSDPQSALLPRIRALSSQSMLGNIILTVKKVIGFSRLSEEGEAASGGEASSTANIGTTNNAIIDPGSAGVRSQDFQQDLSGLYSLTRLSKHQITKKGRFTIRNGKIVKKKVKSYEFKKFKSPDFMKPVKRGADDAAE